jgi:hypothetical protein
MTRRKKPGGKKPKRKRPSELRGKPPNESFDADSMMDPTLPMWLDEQGMHAMLPGSPDAETFARMTEIYQQKIRQSPLWDQMVREFGPEKAEQLLKQCRAEPG